MKRLAVVFGIVMLFLALSYPVIARGPEQGRGYGTKGGRGGGQGSCWGQGGGYGNMSDEQRTQLDKLHQKFRDETAALRTEIWTKSGELNILLDTSNPDAAKAKALQKEITDLRAKMSEKRIALALEARKIAPDSRIGRGYGMGMGFGRHMGGGYGHHWGARGPGGCWN